MAAATLLALGSPSAVTGVHEAVAQGHSSILLFVVTPLELQPAAGASARVTPGDLSRPLLAQLGQPASTHCSPTPFRKLPPALGCGAAKRTQQWGTHFPMFWAGMQPSQALLPALPRGTGPQRQPGPLPALLRLTPQLPPLRPGARHQHSVGREAAGATLPPGGVQPSLQGGVQPSLQALPVLRTGAASRGAVAVPRGAPSHRLQLGWDCAGGASPYLNPPQHFPLTRKVSTGKAEGAPSSLYLPDSAGEAQRQQTQGQPRSEPSCSSMPGCEQPAAPLTSWRGTHRFPTLLSAVLPAGWRGRKGPGWKCSCGRERQAAAPLPPRAKQSSAAVRTEQPLPV